MDENPIQKGLETGFLSIGGFSDKTSNYAVLGSTFETRTDKARLASPAKSPALPDGSIQDRRRFVKLRFRKIAKKFKSVP
jgi:hypothetical protein